MWKDNLSVHQYQMLVNMRQDPVQGYSSLVFEIATYVWGYANVVI